ncbi:uncharacterized protein BT62DRAFT_1004937 [Guyanagaster necrorhizus]|uniref:Uncharacterized protein n=1 Tax=Guyanagaster necrorhizus TaxID=856835 RepID=A0A9P8AUX1_9AGAR|nr:uncharacterized protein BT62DRAFT_1004937 [Guyanagaster necrorhizus MCA 3950]KAG7447337.1 hypothetical protein BT62DRAFT_1004937 [Guyanagaster necrorhizus MCA 3950]
MVFVVGSVVAVTSQPCSTFLSFQPFITVRVWAWSSPSLLDLFYIRISRYTGVAIPAACLHHFNVCLYALVISSHLNPPTCPMFRFPIFTPLCSRLYWVAVYSSTNYIISPSSFSVYRDATPPSCVQQNDSILVRYPTLSSPYGVVHMLVRYQLTYHVHVSTELGVSRMEYSTSGITYRIAPVDLLVLYTRNSRITALGAFTSCSSSLGRGGPVCEATRCRGDLDAPGEATRYDVRGQDILEAWHRDATWYDAKVSPLERREPIVSVRSPDLPRSFVYLILSPRYYEDRENRGETPARHYSLNEMVLTHVFWGDLEAAMRLLAHSAIPGPSALLNDDCLAGALPSSYLPSP